MYKIFIFQIFLFFSTLLNAQTHNISGDVIGEDGNPLLFASVVLLNPADSTLQFFGITNNQGHFEIKNIRENRYLMQVSFIGYQTIYRNIAVPGAGGNNLGIIPMKPKPVDVGEVKVIGDRIPLMIKKDTVEFNAAAFKMKTDAVTEDLLKKLPGIEVDRAGNIKAMGEDVKKVFVDGKEFFGNDPKVATKNIPAKAIDKVQVYDRKSEEAMFTGINDGSRLKTINLKLQEDQKNAIFGDLLAGGGTSERFMGSAKVYKFNDKIQFAALGMANNVNQFGFSLDDYLNFSGGMSGMMQGGGSAAIRITSDSSFPINFGQPITGMNTAGSGGLNFSRSKGLNNRIFISYLGNGSEKKLDQQTNSTNYLQNSSYTQNDQLNENRNDEAHRINFGIRNRIDSTRNININGNLAISSAKDNRNLLTKNSAANQLVNELSSFTVDNSDQVSGDLSGSYLKKINTNKTVFEISGNSSFSAGLSRAKIDNTTKYYSSNQNIGSSLFQDNNATNFNYMANISFTQRIGPKVYIEPGISLGTQVEKLDRTQGFPLLNDMVVDSLSPVFKKHYGFFRPGLTVNRNTDKVRISFGIQAESGTMKNDLNNNRLNGKNYFYLVPSFSYENEYRTGKRIMLNYSSSVNTPNVSQLLPVVNNLNPLVLVKGNPNLKPEYQQGLNVHWLYFDQFSFTSLFTAMNATFTNDKINWDRKVSNRLLQENNLYNAENDLMVGGNASFSTPIRKLGLKINLNLNEGWNRGMNRINSTDNVNTNRTHRISLSADNRKKEKVDINSGIEISVTRSRYSVQQELDNDYFDLSWFGEIRYNPNKNWNLEASADITRYTARSFGESVNIPLIGGEISRYFLRNNRGTLTLRAFDLLNQNRIVQRMSELNYLREIRSNSMGQYVMLSFTYRLNKFGHAPGGIDIKMQRR